MYVDLDGQQLFNPSLDLTGIHLTPPSIPESRATPVGLLVGRAERRAWIRTARGSGDFAAFVVDLGWEPSRIDIADLELTHIEYLHDEVISATRIRLEDLDISEVEGAGWTSIRVPTLGRKVAHELLLYTLDGELLDKSGPYPIVESVHMTLVANEHKLPPVVSGITEPPPELDQRLERAVELAAKHEASLKNGVQARVIADRQTALERLAAHLNRARGELLVRDRYFGQHVEEWRLLDEVPVPVRVLTGKIAKGEIPAIAPHVQARYRPGEDRLSERVYLWDGGGLSVGGSPSTFGRGVVRMTRIRTSEAEVWRAEFEALWNSELFQEVPRQSAKG